MKSLKNTNLYSRLTLITSVTLVVGYFVVYAAWTALDRTDADSGKPLTATLMQGIVDNVNDLNTRVSNFSFSSGNVGIGTTSPTAILDVNGGMMPAGITTPFIKFRFNYTDNTTTIPAIQFRNIGDTSTNAQISFPLSNGGSAVNMVFSTYHGGIITEDIRISNGNVGIGTTSPTSKLDVRGVGVNGGGITTGLVVSHIGSMAADGAGIEFTYANAGIGGNGNIARIIPYVQTGGGGDILFQTAPSNISAYTTKMKVQRDGNAWLAGTLTQASDLRLKKNIRSIDSGISTIEKLRGVIYNWKDEKKDKDLQYGFVAQEVEKILPDLVKTDDKGYKSVNYTGIIPILVKSAQEQQLQTEELKSQILELRKENNNLKILMRLVEEKIENLESK